MSNDTLEVLPEAHRGTARTAISAAFGPRQIGDVAVVTGGASGALTYTVEVGGRSYLMRIETRRGPLRNPHQYACMQAAADAGVAPPLHHVDETAGVAIMDFLPQRPLDEYPGGPGELALALGKLVRRLQETPKFPRLVDYLDALQRMLNFASNSGRFAAGLLEPHREGFAHIREAYAWDAAGLVSSHNDPNPRNIIFDGTRLWLIDWETAYLNDPLVDVAIVVDALAASHELESALLQAWLGRAPDPMMRNRLTMMRSFTRLYYGCLLLIGLGAAPGAEPVADLSAMTPPEFMLAVQEGRLRPGAPETAFALGKMHLAAFLASLGTPELEQAMAAARHG